jgi:hypothetical protein
MRLVVVAAWLVLLAGGLGALPACEVPAGNDAGDWQPWSLDGSGSWSEDAGANDAGALDAGVPDAGPPVIVDAGQPDGPAVRRACTSTFGTGLSATHGRLDGTLVSVVLPSVRTCNGDADHVHLQVSAGGAVYDVAINTTADVWYLARDGGEFGPDFSEGWHTPFKFGYRWLPVTSPEFLHPTSPAQLVQALQAELANVNHISVLGTGYGVDGMHNVHFQEGYSYDGAIITRPLSPNARQLFFRFTTDVF